MCVASDVINVLVCCEFVGERVRRSPDFGVLKRSYKEETVVPVFLDITKPNHLAEHTIAVLPVCECDFTNKVKQLGVLSEHQTYWRYDGAAACVRFEVKDNEY